MRIVLCLVLFVCCSESQVQQVAAPIHEPRTASARLAAQCATHREFVSHALHRSMGYCLILPKDYGTSNASYPVLYLLHGLWGTENDWMARTRISELVRDLPLIVVMPQGDDGWYTNSATIPEAKYEDYAFVDLVNEIDSQYRTMKSREARFIAGLSMGGYGAVKAALRYPDMFAAAGGFSGVYHATEQTRFKTLSVAFGEPDNSSRKRNDVFALLEISNASLPYFFVMTGSEDESVLEDNRDFLKALSKKEARYEYHEVPGKHEWFVWERCLRMFLDVITPQLRAKMG